jgi:cysteine desulfurase
MPTLAGFLAERFGPSGVSVVIVHNTTGISRREPVKDDPLIYLDNAATTKPKSAVVDKISKMLTEAYGNPSSRHIEGARARDELEVARCKLADVLGATSAEVVFTSGGTESNNLALFGVAAAHEPPCHLVVSAVEHPSVFRVVRVLRERGCDVSFFSLRDGCVDLDELNALVREDTRMVSAMLVNNETGTILPVPDIVRMVRQRAPRAVIHCDAVQALGKIPFTVDELGVDLLSVSAHKIGGPKGVGALYVRAGTPLKSLVFGGGQERGLRSGTEASPLIAGFGLAVELARGDLGSYANQVTCLRDYLLNRLAGLPGAVLNSNCYCAPHIVSFSIPGIDDNLLVKRMSDKGFCISNGSACKSNLATGPTMMMSFGLSEAVADTAVRVSLSTENTLQEVEAFIDTLQQVLPECHLD